MGSGSPKNHNGFPRPNNYHNQSPLKSEEFKGIGKVIIGNVNSNGNHHGIMSDLGISQNSTTNGVMSLNNEGNGNQYRTMMIADMNTQ